MWSFAAVLWVNRCATPSAALFAMPNPRAHPSFLPTDFSPTTTATPTAHSITSSRW
jgi:hypothetical protein